MDEIEPKDCINSRGTHNKGGLERKFENFLNFEIVKTSAEEVENLERQK